MRPFACLFGLSVLFAASTLSAVEYKPYPAARITPEQWTAYHAQVRTEHAASAQELREHKLVTYNDRATVTSYAFTQPGHPAHPAWITRRIVLGEKPTVDQIGYFAGDEAPFAELFRQYQETNKRMIEEMRKPQPAR